MNSWGALSDFSDFSGISDLGMAFIPFGTSEVWSLLSHHHLLEAVVRGPGPGKPGLCMSSLSGFAMNRSGIRMDQDDMTRSPKIGV